MRNPLGTMLHTRAFEDAAERLSPGGVSALGSAAGDVALGCGPLHLYTGQEAAAAEATGCGVKRLGVPRLPVGYAHALEEATRVRPAAIVAAALEMLA